MAPRYSAALIAGLIVLAAGCRPDGAGTPTASEPLSTTAAVDADTVLPAPPQVTAGTPIDSLRAEVARLTDRLDAMIVATDSLRAVVSAPATAVPPAVQESPTAPAELFREAGDTARNYGLRAFWAFIVLAFTFYLVRLTNYVLDRLAERSAQRRLFFKRLAPIARILLWTGAAFFVVRFIFDVDARGLIAAFAAVGVAVGFAAQDLLKNIFGGLVIVFDQPFQVGDKIQVGGTYGEVVAIGLRSTRIVTADDSMVSVPNAQVVDTQVSNANSGALDCQVVTDLYLPGWVDEARAKRIAHEVATSSRYVYLGKPVVVLVRDEFDDTFITHLKVKAYVVDTRHEFKFMSDITERARAEFRRQGLLRPWHGAREYVDLNRHDGAAAPGPTATGQGET